MIKSADLKKSSARSAGDYDLDVRVLKLQRPATSGLRPAAEEETDQNRTRSFLYRLQEEAVAF